LPLLLLSAGLLLLPLAVVMCGDNFLRQMAKQMQAGRVSSCYSNLW
jgi:hypothetical protein